MADILHDSWIPPQRSPKAIAGTLAATVFGGAAAGLALAWLLAPGSAVAQFAGFMALPLVLGFGYQLWRARVASFVARRFGWGLLKAVWHIAVNRQPPESVKLMPAREDAEVLMRQMLRGMSGFTHAGLAVGVVAAPLAGLGADGSFVLTTLVFFAACAGFGRLCTRLARNGYLPPPDGD